MIDKEILQKEFLAYLYSNPDESIVTLVNFLAINLKNQNLDFAELLKMIRRVKVLDELQTVAYESGYEELGDRIKVAEQVIKYQQIDAFKKAIKDGTEDEFLEKMNWIEIFALKTDLKLVLIDPQEEKQLSELEQKMFYILSRKIVVKAFADFQQKQAEKVILEKCIKPN